MFLRSLWIAGVIVMVIVITTACSRVPLDNISDPEASPVPELETDEPENDATPGAVPTRVQPTPQPSGTILRIRAVPARQVIVSDPELPAEYMATRFTLFQRTESHLWSYLGSLPVDGKIIADPGDPERLYIGDHPPCTSDLEPIPFYRSLDGGQGWQRIEDADNIRPIMVLSENPEVVIGTRCGLVVSQDGAKTWQSYFPESGFELTQLANTPIGLFGVFSTGDQISYLRRIDMQDPAKPVFEDETLTFWGPGAVHATQDRIFVGDASGVHFSDDGGRTWSFTREGIQDVVTSVDPLREEIPEPELQEGIGIFAIAPHPRDSSRVFLGTVRGLYLSEDGGESWGRIPEVEDFEIRELTFTMNGAILYATAPEGVIVLHNP